MNHDRLLDLLREVANCGARDLDPRIPYVEVQMDRSLWDEIKSAASASTATSGSA